MKEFLINALKRHYDETRVLFEQLTDENIKAEPVSTGRPLGELLLHMIRAMEFYPIGIIQEIWEPLPFTLEKYNTINQILSLYDEVVDRCHQYLETIKTHDLNETIYVDYSKSNVSKKEILLEFLEHNVGHRGQLLVYLRLLGIKPEKISFKV